MKLYFTILSFLCCSSLSAGDSIPCISNQHLAITLTITKVNSTCQQFNGRLYIAASGGVAPYTYEVNANWGYYSLSNTGVFGSVPSGNFTITVTDAIGTTVNQADLLANTLTPPSARGFVASVPAACNIADGSIRVEGVGGLPPYLYTMDNINYLSNNIFTGLTEGAYRYAVKDANGCTSIDPITFFNPTLDLSNPGSCPFYIGGHAASYNCNPYRFSLAVGPPNGGTLPYAYSRDGVNFQTNNEFNNLAAGVHFFTIKDAVGRKMVYGISFLELCVTPFIVNTELQPAQCGVDGSITVTPSNGVAPYLYSIDGINFQTDNIFGGLTPGFYTITVKDADGLLTLKYIELRNSCTVAIADVKSSTCGNANGKIIVDGANGAPPYKYSLDGINYSTTNEFLNLAANSYRVYAKDANNKVGFADVVLSNIAGVTIANATAKHSGCENRTGEINAVALGGTAPYMYSINGGAYQPDSSFLNLSAGVYTINIKDANGCVDTKQATVPVNPDLPSVNFGTNKTVCEDQNLLLNATNTNATYQWQDNTTTPTYLVTAAGNYFVAVTKAGCIAKDTIVIAYNLKPKFTLGADSRLCLGSVITLDPKITEAVNYLWQDGSTNATYKVTQPGLYSLTATNSCGATTDYITIGEGVCSLYVPNSFTPNGDAKNDLFKAHYGDNVTEYQLQVFNRYGQIIFTTTDKKNGWDGTNKGIAQPYGSYVWAIKYKNAVNNNWERLQGVVLLIR